jgi:hypothetical protein
VNRLDVCRVDHVRYSRNGTFWHLPPMTRAGRIDHARQA